MDEQVAVAQQVERQVEPEIIGALDITAVQLESMVKLLGLKP